MAAVAYPISLATSRRQADVYGRCWPGRLANRVGGAIYHTYVLSIGVNGFQGG